MCSGDEDCVICLMELETLCDLSFGCRALYDCPLNEAHSVAFLLDVGALLDLSSG